MEAAAPYETLIPIHQTIRRHLPESIILITFVITASYLSRLVNNDFGRCVYVCTLQSVMKTTAFAFAPI